jgi:hypothetical protein
MQSSLVLGGAAIVVVWLHRTNMPEDRMETGLDICAGVPVVCGPRSTLVEAPFSLAGASRRVWPSEADLG